MKIYIKKENNESKYNKLNNDINISFLSNDTNKKDIVEYEDTGSSDIDILDSLFSIEKDKKSKRVKKEKKPKKKKKKKIKTKLDGLLDSEESNITNSKLSKRNKDDFYEERYKAPLLLLKNILYDINATQKEQQTLIQEYKDRFFNGNGKVQPMALSSMIGNVTSLLTTRLGVIKEISTVYNKISELELKRENQNFKNTGGDNGKNDSPESINDIMDKALESLLFNNNDNHYDISPSIIDDDLSTEAVDKRISKMEKNGDIEFSEAEKAFKYEKENIKVFVEYNIMDNDWRFKAIDEEGIELDDYPLPSKKSIPPSNLNLDKMIAKDKYGKVFNIVMAEDFNE